MGRGHDALKTQDFATDGEVAALVSAFENATGIGIHSCGAHRGRPELSGLISSGANIRANARKDPRFRRAPRRRQSLSRNADDVLDAAARTYRQHVRCGSSTLAADQFDRRTLDKAPAGGSALLARAHQIASSTRQMGSARPVADSVLTQVAALRFRRLGLE